MEWPAARLRSRHAIRRFWQEHHLGAHDLIMPVLITASPHLAGPISNISEMVRYGLASIEAHVTALLQAGINAVMLFGVVDKKIATAKQASKPDWGLASDPDGVVQKTIRQIKKTTPNMVVMADCCLCDYLDSSNCAIAMGPDEMPDKASPSMSTIDHAATLEALQSIAITYAASGCDMVCPSGMMDGAAQAVRQALDSAGFGHVSIVDYAVKYASALYHPFRVATCVTQTPSISRNQHQIAPSQRQEAINGAVASITQGSDGVIVKPASGYHDVLAAVSSHVSRPVYAFQVSGEYMLIKLGVANGLFSEQDMVMESLVGLKRAGASKIITYYAYQAAQWLG